MGLKTHTLADDINVFTGHPYLKTSQVNIFEREMVRNTGYSIWYSGSSNYVELLAKGFDVNKVESKRLDIQFVNKELLHTIKNFFNEKKYAFTEDTTAVTLFCQEATEKMQTITFKYIANDMPQQVIFIYSSAPVEILEVSAYMTGFGTQEELLQKALVENDIKMGNHELSHASSSFSIHKSEKEAQQFIDDKIFSSLKSACTPNYVGSYVDDTAEKYRYPDSLTDQDIALGNANRVVFVSGIPTIRAVHKDGTVIVNTRQSESTPLESYYDKEKGILFDLGLNHRQYLNETFIASCANSSKKFLEKFRNSIKHRIEEMKGSAMFDLNGYVAEQIDYKIDPTKIKIRVLGKEKIFE